MTRFVLAMAAAVGTAVILWIGAGFWGVDLLALSVTLIIGAVYAFGLGELLRFRQATAQFTSALADIPAGLASLDVWLQRLPASLQNAVRVRVEGERVALPAPVFTPYLVGLLVMLGLLGTFLGMVATLKGAVFALETTTDLQAVRTGLTAPIKGLGMAFGTSVAGVAASAMLGLISTVCRRERLQATALLDVRMATVLRPFSLAHNRQETFRALQFQAQALPDLVVKLDAMSGQLAQMGQQLGDTLIANQQQMHQSAHTLFAGLASSVEQSLRDNLGESARLAGAVLQPVMETAVASIQRETAQAQQQMSAQMQEQWQRFNSTASNLLEAQAQQDQQRLALWSQQLEQMSSTLVQEWRAASAQAGAQQQQNTAALETAVHELVEQSRSQSGHLLQQITTLLETSDALVQTRIESEQQWRGEHGQHLQELTSALRGELGALREEEAQRGQAAVARLAELEAALAQHLATLGSALEAPMTQLIATASEAPKAAAEVIAQLRQEVSAGIERDNQLLAERNRLAEQLSALLGTLQDTTERQQQSIAALVQDASTHLQQISHDFSGQVNRDVGQLTQTAAQVTVSATEVSSLGEAFAAAVEQFSASSRSLTDNLARVEEALANSSTRSDEQLAYYVAQAREIIDLSMLSQKEIFEELRRLKPQERVAALPVEELAQAEAREPEEVV